MHVHAGGVDQIVDWSKTAPKRKQKRPADDAGDFDDKVPPAMQLLHQPGTQPLPPVLQVACTWPGRLHEHGG